MSKPLSDYIEFLEALHKTFINDYKFECHPPLKELCRRPRMLIVINHATPLSWIPAMTTLAIEFYRNGGGHRSPRGIVDRWFYSNPFTQPIAEFLSQSNTPQTFDELVAHFAEAEGVDLVLSPEGAHSFFGDVHRIQEFRSHRYMELAIKTKSPLLVIGHKGSESWSIPLKLPPELSPLVSSFSKFFGSRLLETGFLNLPIIPHKIDLFQMRCQLYQPSLKAEDISSDLKERHQQILSESLAVRQLMEKLISE